MARQLFSIFCFEACFFPYNDFKRGMNMSGFSNEVQKEIKSYVYRLVDPRNGLTFYVGEGEGNRVFDHVHSANNSAVINNTINPDETKDSLKIQTIKEIQSAGLKVIYIIQRWGMEKDAAFEVEGALIDAFFGLTNENRGHGFERGACNAESLETNLMQESYEDLPGDPNYVILKTNGSFVDSQPGNDYEDKLYSAIKQAWRMNPHKASTIQCPYVLGVVDWIVKEVYEVEEWKQVPDGRYGFEGHLAPDTIRKKYLNHKIPEVYRRGRYPVRYKAIKK